MQRGMLALQKPEIEYALNLVTSSKQNISNLVPRLQSGFDSAQTETEVEIEVSENEVEILLDCLPAPEQNENPVISQFRSKLSQFLAKFRH